MTLLLALGLLAVVPRLEDQEGPMECELLLAVRGAPSADWAPRVEGPQPMLDEDWVSMARPERRLGRLEPVAGREPPLPEPPPISPR